MTTDDSDEPVCGESYDHTLREIYSRDGITAYECTECGAEVTSEDEED